MTLLPALAFGFVLGVRHATDADHVAAVGTIVSAGRPTGSAALVGAMWGVGHSLSVLLAGGALVMLRLPMPTRLALAFEFAVALMLIGLGVRSLRLRAGAPAESRVRPLLVGMVHGLAGTAVLALVVIGATDTALAAAVYLMCFATGTIAGMALFTAILALPARLNARWATRMERGIRLTAGVASVVIGVLLAHRVGIQEGLFAAAPIAGP